MKTIRNRFEVAECRATSARHYEKLASKAKDAEQRKVYLEAAAALRTEQYRHQFAGAVFGAPFRTA